MSEKSVYAAVIDTLEGVVLDELGSEEVISVKYDLALHLNSVMKKARAKLAILLEEQIRVNSSNIESIGFSKSHGLIVGFNGGGLYMYEGVSEDQFSDFLSSQSKGKYFHTFIKNKYPTTKVELNERRI